MKSRARMGFVKRIFVIVLSVFLVAVLLTVFSQPKWKLLEVTVCEINRNAYVNDIEVKHDPVLYELITPFLSEEDREILGF